MRVFSHYSQYPLARWRWPDFTPAEMACHDGPDHTPETLAIDEEAMDRLQLLRNLLGKPMIVNSAFRTPGYNARVGGAPASMHLEARAFDISMVNHDPETFEAAARKAGFTGFGFYPPLPDGRHNFIHIDTGRARFWGTRWKAEPQIELSSERLGAIDFASLANGERAAGAEGHPEPTEPTPETETETTMLDQKAWYQSKTVWGGVVALGSQLLTLTGIQIGPADQADIINAAMQIAGAIGALVVVYGRIRARAVIR